MPPSHESQGARCAHFAHLPLAHRSESGYSLVSAMRHEGAKLIVFLQNSSRTVNGTADNQSKSGLKVITMEISFVSPFVSTPSRATMLPMSNMENA